MDTEVHNARCKMQDGLCNVRKGRDRRKIGYIGGI